MEATEAGRAFVGLARRRQIEHLERSLARYEADLAAGRLGQEWVEPSGITDLMPRLTAASLTELFDTVAGKLEELTARDADDPRAEHVVFVAAGLPLVAPEHVAPEHAASEHVTPDHADREPEDHEAEDRHPADPDPADPDPDLDPDPADRETAGRDAKDRAVTAHDAEDLNP
jgi:hypothetical protein